jgi:acetoacetate decarboxylase
MMVYFRSHSKNLSALIPDHTKPDPEGLCYSFVLDVPFSTGLGPFKESGTSVGVVFKGKKYFFDLDLYVTSDIPMICGREIWGAPKLLADISIDSKGGVDTGTVKRGAEEILKLSFKNERNAKQEEMPAPRPEMKLKVIPHADRSGHAIKQLVAFEPSDFELVELATGRGSVSFGRSILSQAWRLEPAEIIAAFSMVSNSSERYGKVLHDYLKH